MSDASNLPPLVSTPQLKPLRVLFAHKKGDEHMAARLEVCLAQLRGMLEGPPGYRAVSLVSARDEWELSFRRSVTWDRWTSDVATGVGYGGQGPRYHAFVVPDLTVGRPTRNLLNAALRVGKPVWFWDAPADQPAALGAFFPVARVDADPENGNLAHVVTRKAIEDAARAETCADEWPVRDDE